MTIKLFGSAIMFAVALVGGCGPAERRADQGCPDEEVLAASGACCDPALAVVVEGISDCTGSPVVHPDAGTPDAGDAGGFVFPCPKDQLVDWRGDCIKVSSQADGGMDGGVNDAGECVPVVVERCPPPQVRDPETGLCLSEGTPDGGTECPHFECPAGQVLDTTGTTPRCHDLVEACRYTCDPGKLLTDECTCIDRPAPCPSFPCTSLGEVLKADGTCYVPPVPLGPCPGDQARNNGGTCVPVSTPWTFPCNAGESLSANGTTCLPPPKQCDVGTLLNTATQHCDVPPPAWNQTCTASQYLTPNGQQCVTPPAPWSFPCNAGLGEVLKADNTCYVPPVLPPLCPSNQARDNTGTCVVLNAAWTFPCVAPKQLAQDGSCKDPAPGPSLEVSYLAPPPLAGTTAAMASQTGVNFGTLEVRNVANLQLAELPDVSLTVLVADNPSGTYTAGVSGSVRADQRMDGCRLRDWPPLSGTFGPVKPDANGRVLFSGAGLRAQTVRRLTIECDLADLLPVGPTDEYAVDVGSGMQAVVVNGTTRTPMDLSIVSQNGSNPSAKVSVSCGHRITADAGTVSTVRARPTFVLAADSPGGTKSRGYIVIAKYTVTASACEGLSLTRVKVRITYSDNSSTGWGDRAFQNSLARLALSTSESQAWGTQTFANKTSGAFTLATDATAAPLLVPAGQSRTFSVLMDVNEASANTHDAVRVFPQDPVSWYGQDNPSGYPALAKAPDFVAAASVAVSF